MHSSMSVENACIKKFLVNVGVTILDYIDAPDQPFKYTMADGWMAEEGSIRVCTKKRATP